METDCSRNSCRITPMLPPYGPGRSWMHILWDKFISMCRAFRREPWPVRLRQATQWSGLTVFSHITFNYQRTYGRPGLPAWTATRRRLPRKAISRQCCHKHDRQNKWALTPGMEGRNESSESSSCPSCPDIWVGREVFLCLTTAVFIIIVTPVIGVRVASSELYSHSCWWLG